MASEPASGPSRPRGDSGLARAGWIFSILVHAVLVAFLMLSHFLVQPPPPATPVVFELVNLEPPRLRPVAPPTPQPPPETPRPQARPPEPPRPTPAPRQPEPPRPRPEPRATAPQPEADPTLPVEETPPDPGQLTTTLVANIPSDPRLAFWAGRVRRIVEAQWNPPEGIDVRGRVKTVIGFQVSRTGQVSGVEVTEGAGNALLDELAKRTILRVEQLPPIPESFPGEVLRVSYEFIYQGR